MRILVLAFAILLLPLRGWLGDAMAMQPVQQPHQPAAVAPAAHVEAMPHGEHAAHAGDASHGDAVSLAPDCQSTCANCQLCHSVAMTVWPELPMPADAARAAPVFAPMAFESAEPAPGFKPPIS